MRIMGFSDDLFRRLKLLPSRFLKLTSGTWAPTRSGCAFSAESGTDWAQTSTAPVISSNPQQSDKISFLNKPMRILFLPPFTIVIIMGGFGPCLAYQSQAAIPQRHPE